MSDRGWAATLGVASSTLIDQGLITRILNYLEERIRREWPDPIAPGAFNPIYEQKIRDWRAATDNALHKYLGVPIGSLPPSPLDWDPSVRQPEGALDLVTGGAIGEALAGAADIVGKGLILLAIGGVMFMGSWLLFREPPVIIQQLRRAAT